MIGLSNLFSCHKQTDITAWFAVVQRVVTGHVALVLVCVLSFMLEASAARSSVVETEPVVHEINLHDDHYYGDRLEPEKVPPIVQGDVKYVVIHLAGDSGAPHNGGYIEARDKKTGKKLWGVQVYTTVYDPDLEGDVQDVFITKVTLDAAKGVLLVKDEMGRSYSVDIKTKKVEQVTKN